MRAGRVVMFWAGLIYAFSAGAEKCREQAILGDPSARLDYIADELDSEAARLKTWNLGWTAGFSALAALQLGAAYFAPMEPMAEGALYVGALKAFIGAVAQVVRPLEGKRVDRESGRDECDRLARAEAALVKTARNESVRRGWSGHAEILALNTAALLVLGFGFEDWRGGVTSALTGMVALEMRLYFSPTGAIDALERYEKGFLVSSARRTPEWLAVPIVVSGGLGLGLVGEF